MEASEIAARGHQPLQMGHHHPALHRSGQEMGGSAVDSRKVRTRAVSHNVLIQ